MSARNLFEQLEREAEIGRAVIEVIAKIKDKYTVKRKAKGEGSEEKEPETKKGLPKRNKKKNVKEAPVPPPAA